MSLNGIKKADLLALPDRADWQATTAYDSLLVFGSKSKHESGWCGITIVGVNGDTPVEKVTTYSDDIEWIQPNAKRLPGGMPYGGMRMDCTYPSRVLHFWAREPLAFHIGLVVSSVTIELKERT